MKAKRYHLFLLLSGLAVLIWSGWFPKERVTWLMETFPAIIGGIILLATYRRFRLTSLTYTLIWLFSLILMIGGHWTYAEVPLGFWIQDAFGLARNHYDRIGHFFQGVVPAMLAREVLLRTSPLRPGKWTFFIITCIALAISACYELFEWGYAVAFGQGSESFLGSQGDIWDAQWDMFLALCGAMIAQVLLSRWQEIQIYAIITDLDETQASEYLGRTVLIGLTYYGPHRKLVDQRQLFGTIRTFSNREGIQVELEGSDQPCCIAPDKRIIRKAEPGSYTLRSTGQTVNDPDFLITWTCQLPEHPQHAEKGPDGERLPPCWKPTWTSHL